MSRFSIEFLFRECVLYHHCILLRLCKAIKWDSDVVNEIFMVDMYMEDFEKELMLINIADGTDNYGAIKIKAFAGQESPYEGKFVLLSTDDILEIEIQNK